MLGLRVPKTGLPIIWEAVHVFRANGDALPERSLASSSEHFAVGEYRCASNTMAFREGCRTTSVVDIGFAASSGCKRSSMVPSNMCRDGRASRRMTDQWWSCILLLWPTRLAGRESSRLRSQGRCGGLGPCCARLVPLLHAWPLVLHYLAPFLEDLKDAFETEEKPVAAFKKFEENVNGKTSEAKRQLVCFGEAPTAPSPELVVTSPRLATGLPSSV